MNKNAAREEYLKGIITPMDGKISQSPLCPPYLLSNSLSGSWIDLNAHKEECEAQSPNNVNNMTLSSSNLSAGTGVQNEVRKHKTATSSTAKLARQRTDYQLRARTPQTTVYIDIEEDLTQESVIFSSEYNGSAPPQHQEQQQHSSVVSSDDDNSFILGCEYESESYDEDDDEPQVLAHHNKRHQYHRHHLLNRLPHSPPQKSKGKSAVGPPSPSDIDLRASFTTLLHGNYKKAGNSGPDSVDRMSSSVRLNSVCLVPESEMEQRRSLIRNTQAKQKPEFATTSPGEVELNQKGYASSSTRPESRSSRSSRSSSTSTADPSSPQHRRRRRSSRSHYHSSPSGRPFGQVDISTVSLAAAGISLVAGLSFSAGYALGRRSDVHLAVAS